MGRLKICMKSGFCYYEPKIVNIAHCAARAQPRHCGRSPPRLCYCSSSSSPDARWRIKKFSFWLSRGRSADELVRVFLTRDKNRLENRKYHLIYHINWMSMPAAAILFWRQKLVFLVGGRARARTAGRTFELAYQNAILDSSCRSQFSRRLEFQWGSDDEVSFDYRFSKRQNLILLSSIGTQ